MTARQAVVLPLAAVQPVIGRAFAVGPDAEQRAERIEGVEAPVKAERELVEVRLQVLMADRAVVCPGQPSLQVAENQVDDGQVFFGNLGIVALDNRQMVIAERGQPVVAAPRIRDDHRARLNGGFHKGRQRLSAARRGDFQPQTASVAPAAPHGLVALFGGAGADLDGGDHQRLFVGMDALAFAARHAADVGFVNLDVIVPAQIAADPVPILPHHTRPQLVQDLEGGFVPAQSKLALKLHRGHAGRHARNEVGTPKPSRQRGVCLLHHGPGRQRMLAAAGSASKDGRARAHAERLALLFAVGADKALGPFGPFKVARARRVIREKLLELRKRLRKRQVFPLEDIGMGRHGLGLHHRRAKCPLTAETLAQVPVCVNRIGM